MPSKVILFTIFYGKVFETHSFFKFFFAYRALKWIIEFQNKKTWLNIYRYSEAMIITHPLYISPIKVEVLWLRVCNNLGSTVTW